MYLTGIHNGISIWSPQGKLRNFGKYVEMLHNGPASNDNMSRMKGQSEIAFLPKFAIIMLIVMVIVITDIL